MANEKIHNEPSWIPRNSFYEYKDLYAEKLIALYFLVSISRVIELFLQRLAAFV